MFTGFMFFLLALSTSTAFKSVSCSKLSIISKKLKIPKYGLSNAEDMGSLYSQSKRCFTLLSEIDGRVGEDAASFSIEQQSVKSWGIFGAAVATVLSFLYYIWIYDNGPQLGNEFKDSIEALANHDTTLAITYMLGFFAVAHSGLASLRPTAEEIIGARAWRVIFALVSLPLAFSCIVYFINHRYKEISYIYSEFLF
jgi:NnrU protein